MKKLNQLLFMLLVVILLNLVGCEMKNNLKSEEQTKVESKTSQVIADTQWSDTMQIHWNHRVYLPKEYEEIWIKVSCTLCVTWMGWKCY